MAHHHPPVTRRMIEAAQLAVPEAIIASWELVAIYRAMYRTACDDAQRLARAPGVLLPGRSGNGALASPWDRARTP